MKYPESESSSVELKREFPRNDQIIKTIIGFCNQNGGKLVIGVDDNKKIIGIAPSVLDQALESVEKAIFDSSAPSIIPRVYTQRFEEGTVLIIEVAPGMSKPYYRRSEGMEKGTYIRLGRNTVRATSSIIQELQWQSMGIEFEDLPVHQATSDDLDQAKVASFLSSRINYGKSSLTEDVMRSYHLIVPEHSRMYPTNAGLLLFGRAPQFYLSEAMIICSHFRGITGREAIATIDCEGTLLEQYEQAFAFVLSRLNRAFTIRSSRRSETLELPEIAIREAILNAIIHRNYHIKAPTKIALYDDRIEIFSPGQFPGPLDPKNLQTGITYLRNPAICKVLREAGYVEKLGTGFISIFRSYKERKLKIPQVIEGENFVKCILPREPLLEETRPNDLHMVLSLFDTQDVISMRDVMRHLSCSRATANRRLRELVDSNKIERLGKAKAVCYRLKERV